MKTWFNRHKLYLIAAPIGALAGFFYWQQVGCLSGTCAITSSPVNSSIYAAAMAVLLVGMFKKDNKEVTKEENIPS